jgi:hypothetical protein
MISVAGDNRGKTAFDEIVVGDGLVRGFEDLAELQRDRIEVRLQQSQIGGRQCREKPISARKSRNLGHGS